jgi:hypothetical protein
MMARVFGLTVALGASAVVAHAESFWPRWQAPTDAHVQSVAPDVVLNGKRSRILQIDSSANVEAMLGFYRQQFGTRRVENKLGQAQIIAAREGEFFHTVQIERSGPGGAKATVITTAASPSLSKSTALHDTQAWLPADTKTLQTMESTDGGMRAVTVNAVNTQALQANRDQLLQAMQQRGFRLVREDKPKAVGAGVRDGVSLWLSAGEEQATVTVVDTGERRFVSIVRTKEAK